MHKTTSTDVTNISRDDQIHTAMQEPPHILTHTHTNIHTKILSLLHLHQIR